MKPPKSKPIYTTPGAVKIRVLRNGNAGFCVPWRAFKGAPRTREHFGPKAKTAAIQRADAIAQAISNGQSDALTLTAASRDEYKLALQQAAAIGLPLHVALAELRAARAALPAGHTVLNACETYAASIRKKTACPATATIYLALIRQLETDPQRPRSDSYIRVLTPRLRAIAGAFPDLTALTKGAFEDFLRGFRFKGQALQPKTYNHYHAAGVQLLLYAQDRAYLPPGPHALADSVALEFQEAIDVYTLDEMRYLLAHVPQQWIPLFTIGAFAGLRVCEIGRLAWQHFHWDEGEIEIAPQVAGKRGAPRNVPIPENLAACLCDYRNKMGRIYDLSERRLHEKLHPIRRALEQHPDGTPTGFVWKQNALRHSFGSYYVALHRNLETTRTIMGTSIGMIRKHYNNPRFRTHATAYFQLRTSQAENITPITGAAHATA